MIHTASPLQDVLLGRRKMPKVKADHHLHCLATMTCNSSWLANNLIQVFCKWRAAAGNPQVALLSCLSCGLQQGFSDLEHKSAFRSPHGRGVAEAGVSPPPPLVSLLAEPSPECFLLTKSKQDFLSPTPPH